MWIFGFEVVDGSIDFDFAMSSLIVDILYHETWLRIDYGVGADPFIDLHHGTKSLDIVAATFLYDSLYFWLIAVLYLEGLGSRVDDAG